MNKITISIVVLLIILGLSIITLLKLSTYQSGNIVLYKNIKDVETYSPIPITKVLVLGRGDITALPICSNDWEYANFFGNDFYVFYNGFYFPSNILFKDTYYNATSTSIGDYIPSLIGQNVYLTFTTNNNENTSSFYIVKTENIEGNEVIWNLTFDGNTNNSIYISNMNYSMQNHIVLANSWDITGMILPNGTALISPYTNTGGSPNCSLHQWRNDMNITILIIIILTALIVGLVVFKIKKYIKRKK